MLMGGSSPLAQAQPKKSRSWPRACCIVPWAWPWRAVLGVAARRGGACRLAFGRSCSCGATSASRLELSYTLTYYSEVLRVRHPSGVVEVGAEPDECAGHADSTVTEADKRRRVVVGKFSVRPYIVPARTGSAVYSEVGLRRAKAIKSRLPETIMICIWVCAPTFRRLYWPSHDHVLARPYNTQSAFVLVVYFTVALLF